MEFFWWFKVKSVVSNVIFVIFSLLVCWSVEKKEGWEEGKKGGRKEGRKEGREEVRKEGRKDGWMDGWMDRTEGR